MSVTTGNKISDLPQAQAALLDLCRPFVKDPDAFAPKAVVIQPDEIPFPQDNLLVHHDHMTLVLEKHHHASVAVHVHEEHLGGDLYTRKISLTPIDSNKVVEWGIVRMDFRYMASAVRDEILAKKLPLGAILTKHDVLRRIKPRWFIRCPADGPVLQLFNPHPASADAYGRLGTIYCNDEPAIELMEIVVNV